MNQRAFTLLEIMLVVMAVVVLVSLRTFFSNSFVNKQYLNDETERLIARINTQYTRAKSGYQDSDWSVYFDQNGKSYTLFRGNDYENRDPTFDEVYSFHPSVDYQAVTLVGSGNIVTFSRPDGGTGLSGTIALENNEGLNSEIFINQLGLISMEGAVPQYGGEENPPPEVPEEEPPPPPPQEQTVDLVSDRDSSMYKYSANSNYGSEQYIWVQSWFNFFHRRGIVHFDLSAIPQTATVSSATLTLNVYNTQGTTRTYGVHRLTQVPQRDWTESHVTWNRYKSSTNWTSAGGDFAPTPTATQNAGSWPGSPYPVQFDVTADVQNFVSDPVNNFGWVIRDENEGGTAQYYVHFASKEHINQLIRPALHVIYQEP